MEIHPPRIIWQLSSWDNLFLPKLWTQSICKMESQLMFAAMAWQMWKARNNRIFKGSYEDPRVIAGKALSVVDECSRLIAHKDPSHVFHLQKIPMCKPSEGDLCLMNSIRASRNTFIITDGSVDCSSRVAGAGFVIVQDQLFTVIEAGFLIWLWASPARAEGEAVRQGVRIAKVKVDRQFVKAPEALAKFARRTQTSNYTELLEDNCIREKIQWNDKTHASHANSNSKNANPQKNHKH
ncbi:hypothetical protein QJS10_CPA03g01460 [Acorus calamus]|uniref:Uncharacterized protein n=1 Tax=Acorus calamus TaxID=4465 RepID=A0AAV9FA62_ACOCL|nr:hypothetical protein QJS10_CPA03g01460 [Acorus calamus]